MFPNVSIILTIGALAMVSLPAMSLDDSRAPAGERLFSGHAVAVGELQLLSDAEASALNGGLRLPVFTANELVMATFAAAYAMRGDHFGGEKRFLKFKNRTFNTVSSIAGTVNLNDYYKNNMPFYTDVSYSSPMVLGSIEKSNSSIDGNIFDYDEIKLMQCFFPAIRGDQIRDSDLVYGRLPNGYSISESTIAFGLMEAFVMPVMNKGCERDLSKHFSPSGGIGRANIVRERIVDILSEAGRPKGKPARNQDSGSWLKSFEVKKQKLAADLDYANDAFVFHIDQANHWRNRLIASSRNYSAWLNSSSPEKLQNMKIVMANKVAATQALDFHMYHAAAALRSIYLFLRNKDAPDPLAVINSLPGASSKDDGFFVPDISRNFHFGALKYTLVDFYYYNY